MKSGTTYCRSSTVVVVHELKSLYIGNCMVEKTCFSLNIRIRRKVEDKAKCSEHVLTLNYHTLNTHEGLE